jgi:addiction module toxin, txe/yoeB family
MQPRIIQWDLDAWNDYLYWQANDKRLLRRINELIRDMVRNPFEGIGKPEKLKGNLSGFLSRRIDSEHRLVYAVDEKAIYIISCKGHY